MTAFEDTIEWGAKALFGFGGGYNNWQYRRPITINNTSGGVLSNYQVEIELTPSNFTYTHSKADGADMRFVQDDGVTALDYWIEEWVEAGTSKVHVEIDSIPTGETVCAYILHGNDEEDDESNDENTFEFSDDIEGWRSQKVGNGGSSGFVELSNGDIFIAYSRSGNIHSRKSTNNDSTWGSESGAIATGGWPSIDRIDGILYLSYAVQSGADFALKFRKSTDNGSSWGSEIPVTATNQFADSNILALASNNLLIASINNAQDTIYIYKSTDGGANWSLFSTPLSGASNNQEDVFLIKLSNDNLLLQWEEEVVELGKSYLKSKISTDNGSTWGSVITIWNSADNNYDYEGSGFFYDNGGDLISIVYTNEDEVLTNNNYENYKLKYKKSTDQGASWGSASILIQDTRGIGPCGSAIKTSNDKILIATTEHWLTTNIILVTRINDDLTTPDIITAASKWATGQGKCYIETENNSKIAKIEGYGTGDTKKRGFFHSDYSGGDYKIKTRMKGECDNLRFCFRYTDTDNHYLFNISATGVRIYKRVGGAYTEIDIETFAGQADTWYLVELKVVGTAIKAYIDGTLYNDFTDNIYSSGKVALSTGNTFGTDQPGFFDYFCVSKCVSTEPTYSVGDELGPIRAVSTALSSGISWTAKGAFATPTMSLTELIEWDAKGGIAVTAQGAYLDTIEWTAAGKFTPPHSFIFIDLR